jgi:hypothetical protein
MKAQGKFYVPVTALSLIRETVFVSDGKTEDAELATCCQD